VQHYEVTPTVSDLVEKQIDRAWLHHRAERDRIPMSVRRELNVIKRALEPTSAKIKLALNDEPTLCQLVNQCCRRRGMPRQRLHNYFSPRAWGICLPKGR
jgi:hypothetical protein